MPSERCSIQEQSIKYCGWSCFLKLSWGVWLGACYVPHPEPTHNTPIKNIISTAPQLNISQKALGTLPEDGNVMPKHVGANIYN
jgi:hypothetical protein